MSDSKKVKVWLKPGPWEGMQYANGVITLNEEWEDKHWYSPHDPMIDRIEPMPDYEAWIRDKVPVIGWSRYSTWTEWYVGYLERQEDGDLMVVGGCDEESQIKMENYCLWSKEALEKLQRGERPE